VISKTNGIVINYVKYSESSIICKIFTQSHGIQSFLINGVRSKSKTSKNKIALFQPLTQLEIVMYYKQSKNLQRISEVKCINPCVEIPTVFAKSCIAIFMCEILQKVTVHQDADDLLFAFLVKQISTLECADKQYTPWIPIQFILGLCRVQGFLPSSMQEMKEQLQTNTSSGLGLPSIHAERAIHSLLVEDQIPSISSKERKNLFHYLLSYYQQAIGNLGDIKSLQVLKEMLD